MPIKRKLKAIVVRFPGSNCDFDTVEFFSKFGHQAKFIWYKEKSIPGCDLLVLPGGFAFGDRVYAKATATYTIDPGELALRSPIVQAIKKQALRGLPILGICNGFQILVKTGLLPGKLIQNDSKKFFCDFVTCSIGGTSFFADPALLGKKYIIPVAHGYGKFVVSPGQLQQLKQNDQIFLTYQSYNPNGSISNIAGVCNKDKTIFGMMPHPERSPDAQLFMNALESYVAKN